MLRAFFALSLMGCGLCGLCQCLDPSLGHPLRLAKQAGKGAVHSIQKAVFSNV
jgi:hypothetical protein